MGEKNERMEFQQVCRQLTNAMWPGKPQFKQVCCGQRLGAWSVLLQRMQRRFSCRWDMIMRLTFPSFRSRLPSVTPWDSGSCTRHAQFAGNCGTYCGNWRPFSRAGRSARGPVYPAASRAAPPSPEDVDGKGGKRQRQRVKETRPAAPHLFVESPVVVALDICKLVCRLCGVRLAVVAVFHEE